MQKLKTISRNGAKVVTTRPTNVLKSMQNVVIEISKYLPFYAFQTVIEL